MTLAFEITGVLLIVAYLIILHIEKIPVLVKSYLLLLLVIIVEPILIILTLYWPFITH